MVEDQHIDLDLDELAPEPRTIKVAGQKISVYPPKLNDLIKLMAVFSNLQSGENPSGTMQELKTTLDTLVPDLKTNNIDLTMEQFNGLITFIFTMASPSEQKELSSAGISFGSEKKSPEEPSST